MVMVQIKPCKGDIYGNVEVGMEEELSSFRWVVSFKKE
jgi:hypothetical protein